MDKQPKHDEEIVQCDRPEKIVQCDSPYEGHYPLRVRKYYQPQSFDSFIYDCKKMGCPLPDFWWISVKDFPWPDKEMKDE